MNTGRKWWERPFAALCLVTYPVAFVIAVVYEHCAHFVEDAKFLWRVATGQE